MATGNRKPVLPGNAAVHVTGGSEHPMPKQSKPKSYQTGGNVRGPGTGTSDSIIARISNGEYVLPKESVDMVGLSNLEALRQAGLQARQGLPPPPGYADGGMVGNSYGSYVDDETRKRLNADVGNMGNNLDASLKSATTGATPTMSPAYGVGAVSPPAPKPQSALSSSVPATPGNEWGSLNDKWGIERPNASSLPPPPNSWTSGQQQSTTTTPQTQQPYTLQSMQPPPRFQAPQGKGYQQLPGSDYFARSQTLQPGSPEYQDAQRQRLGGGLGSFAGGSNPLYTRSYMGPAGTAVGLSSVAPGRGSLSVADQGNGGTVEGNVAAINRQIAALQDLNQARLDDPVNGRFSFGQGTKNPFSLPGDSFQDSRARAAQFDQLVKDANSGTRGERQSAAKGLQSLMGLMQGNQQQALGLAQVFQNQQENRASALARQQQLRQQAMADAQKYGLDLRRFGLDLTKEERAAEEAKTKPLSTDQTRAWLAQNIMNAYAKRDQKTIDDLTKYYNTLFGEQSDLSMLLSQPQAT